MKITMHNAVTAGEFIYYSIPAREVTWTTRHQCGGYMVPMVAGKVTTMRWQPIYCDKRHVSFGKESQR